MATVRPLKIKGDLQSFTELAAAAASAHRPETQRRVVVARWVAGQPEEEEPWNSDNFRVNAIPIYP